MIAVLSGVKSDATLPLDLFLQRLLGRQKARYRLSEPFFGHSIARPTCESLETSRYCCSVLLQGGKTNLDDDLAQKMRHVKNASEEPSVQDFFRTVDWLSLKTIHELGHSADDPYGCGQFIRSEVAKAALP